MTVLVATGFSSLEDDDSLLLSEEDSSDDEDDSEGEGSSRIVRLTKFFCGFLRIFLLLFGFALTSSFYTASTFSGCFIPNRFGTLFFS